MPAVSPDGREIAFASGGDIWTVAAGGGEARLLVSGPAEESRPLYSPDGARVAFVSTRSGGGDIYVLTLATGAMQRLTFSDAPSNLDGWSRDGEWIYFTSAATDVAGEADILRVRATGGTPLEVSRERYLNEFESAPSPDGKQVALVAKGISSGQWWRNGHSHIDETEVWLKAVAEAGGYRKLLAGGAKHAWPMWAADGKTLFYMSDRNGKDGSGAENIWSADAATGAERQVTHFTSGRCLWPTISYDGKTIVFERHFAVWKLDVRSGEAREVPVVLRGAPSGVGVVHTPLTHWSGLALAPDGNKIAVVDHGDVFAVGAKEGGEAQRLTRTESAENAPEWSPDSTKVSYRSERDGGSSIYLYDFATQAEGALTKGADLDFGATWSPDGKSVAFVRNRKEVHVLAVDGLKDHVVARGEIDNNVLAWSPDGKWLVYVPTGANGFSNLYAVPAAGGAGTGEAARALTFLANGETASRVAWSPDGKYILFDTAQRSETPQLARVDLVPHVPTFREDQFTELFRKQSTPGGPDVPSGPDAPGGPTSTPPPATAPAQEKPAEPVVDAAKAEATQAGRGGRAAVVKKVVPTQIVFEGIRGRLSLLPIDLELRLPVISPDGKTLAFVASVSDQTNIYTYSLDELSREPASPRQLTSTPGNKAGLAWSPDSKTIYYLEGGGQGGGDAPSGVRAVSLETRMPKPIAVNASVEVDFDQEKQVVFDEAWSTLEHRFFRGDFNHHDWKALRDEWQPYIAGVRTGPELRRDINLLIGELNSSHSGINRPAVPAVRTGRLGLRFEREPFEAKGQLIVREVVPLGPASLEGSIKVGDRVLSVDGTTIAAATNLDALLEDRVGKRTVLRVETAGKARDAVLRPVTLQVEAGLLYSAWVEERRAYVEKVSGGKLGYVHIEAMGDHDLAQLYVDLDVQNETKQGVVVDLRNNNGGYVNGRVIDVFARKNYMQMRPRDGATAPARQALGQRALGLPTVLVTNESTLSDGEDFTEGYRQLGLGKVVGTPTAGWIIFTGAQRLIDGSSVRVPGDRILDLKGEDMEMHPRPVDVEVLRQLGETESGEDAQLKKAVEVLLGQVK